MFYLNTNFLPCGVAPTSVVECPLLLFHVGKYARALTFETWCLESVCYICMYMYPPPHVIWFAKRRISVLDMCVHVSSLHVICFAHRYAVHRF